MEYEFRTLSLDQPESSIIQGTGPSKHTKKITLGHKFHVIV
jgi:hypothetical protein